MLVTDASEGRRGERRQGVGRQYYLQWELNKVSWTGNIQAEILERRNHPRKEPSEARHPREMDAGPKATDLSDLICKMVQIISNLPISWELIVSTGKKKVFLLNSGLKVLQAIKHP